MADEQKAKMFWDGVNCVYTDDNRYCPVYRGRVEGIFTETWNSVDSANILLDFAFTKTDKDLGMVYLARDMHFKKYNFQAYQVVRMVLPPSFYDEMYERFIAKDEEKE